MYIRKAKYEDIPAVLTVLDHGRQLIRQSGNTVQWQGIYPGPLDVEQDILNDSCYVVILDEKDIENQTSVSNLVAGSIVGTLCIQLFEEPTYREIKGKWLNDLDYVTIHRIASNQSVKGIGKFCMEYAKAHYSNIKIDTHASNPAMIQLIENSGFTYCGEITVGDGTTRNAYQYSSR